MRQEKYLTIADSILRILAEQLAIEVEDQKDENKTLKRRHTANVKVKHLTSFF